MAAVGAPAHADRSPPPMGLLVGPFLVGLGMVFALAWLLEIPIGLGAVLVALAIGALFTVFALTSRLQRHRAVQAIDTGVTATQGTPETMVTESRQADDPLAHVHRVEDTGRRYALHCANCGQEVHGDPEKCPNCQHRLRFECKRCRTSIKLEWGRCPECGAEF